MQLQCRCCQNLALCNPDQIRLADQPKFVRLEKILRGRELGCIGCRLVCECLPLLNDYYAGSSKPSGLFVHAAVFEATGESHSEASWYLAFGEFIKRNVWQCVGEFELFRTTGEQDLWLDVQAV